MLQKTIVRSGVARLAVLPSCFLILHPCQADPSGYASLRAWLAGVCLPVKIGQARPERRKTCNNPTANSYNLPSPYFTKRHDTPTGRIGLTVARTSNPTPGVLIASTSVFARQCRIPISPWPPSLRWTETNPLRPPFLVASSIHKLNYRTLIMPKPLNLSSPGAIISTPMNKMATSVDLWASTATRPKVPRLKVSAPPEIRERQTRSESAGVSATPLTIAPTIPISKTDNPDKNRYHKPFNQNRDAFHGVPKA